MKKIIYFLLFGSIVLNFISCDKNEIINEDDKKVPYSSGTTSKVPDNIINIINHPSIDINSFTVYLEGKSKTNSNYSIDYTFKNGKWNFSKDILTSGIINIGDYIVIESDLGTNPVTKVKDIVQYETVFDGKNIDLSKLKHINSKITFDIKFDGSNYNIDDLKNYTIKYLDYSFKYGENKSIILTPKTIRAGSVIEILSNFSSNSSMDVYSKEITEAINLTANKELVFSVEIAPITRVTQVTSNSLEWSKVTTNLGKAEIPETKNISVSFPSNGTFDINFVNESKIFSYSYKFGSRLLTPIPDYFYWNNFKDGEYKIFGSFTPDGNGSPEKDILKSSAYIVKWNNPISFDVNLHANALIKFDIVSIAGYSKEQLEQFVSNSKITLKGFDLSESYTTSLRREILIKPKTLSNNDEISLVFNGRTYSVIMSDIVIKSSKLTELKANTKYEITLTIVDGAQIGVSMVIDNWDIINGSGELKL